MDLSRRSSSVFNSPFSPKPRSAVSSRMSLSRSFNDSSRKTSSVHIVLKSSHNVVERFGLSVPVLVEEAFSFSDKNTVITARVAESGYAWVVCGRKLLIWQYQNTEPGLSPKQRQFPVCHELKLPQSDLAHRAELVTVFPSKQQNHPSCVAVSPEGMVRYWPDITHDHSSVDHHVDLNGQECDSLVYAGYLGCVFVTTTCTLVLVQYKPGTYGHQLFCRTLKTPGTWLGGLSKRVSSIFFGPMAGDQGTETRIIRLLATPGIQQMYNIFILAGLTFQKWVLTENDPDQLCWTLDLARQIKDAFRAHITHWEMSDHTDIDAWVLDMQPDKEDGILMLCAGANTQIAPQVYYAMMAVPVNNQNPPTQPKDFLLLKMMNLYKENSPGDALNYKFTLCGNNAYIYSRKTINVIKPTEDPDVLEFLHPQDHLFSGCTCLNVPIFFSRHFGLVTISGMEPDANTTLGVSSLVLDTSLADQSFSTEGTNNLTLYHMDPVEIYNAHRDTAGQLKAAFIFHVKSQLSECYDMVNKLFPSDAPTLPGFDGPLDTVVIKIAKDILDDIPAGDPRWIHGHSGVGSSHSMMVLQQLKDKQKAYALYLKFLKESGLWGKLTGVTMRETRIATIHVLAELAEKVTAAIVMKSIPLSALFDDTLERTVKNYSIQPGDGLSKQDIFYREVTRIHEGILWLAKLCEENSHSQLAPEIIARIIHEGSQIMLTVLTEVIQYRQQCADNFLLNETSKSMKLEYLPWTVCSGPEGLGDAILLQHVLTMNYGIKLAANSELKAVLVQEFVMLTDIILDGRKTHLTTVKRSREKVLYKNYCFERNKLIKPLMDEKLYEQAAMLAEKYLEFEILMRICEITNNEERLNEYMRRFKDTGFIDFVYHWYLREGKQAKLLERYRKLGGQVPEGQEHLGRFLSAFPTLSWIQQFFDKDFSAASETLRQLAEAETELVTRRKSMLSLSKLARLAAPPAIDQEEHIQDINKRLELILLQEYIPDYVLQEYGFDINHLKVLHPRDLIALYICPEYVDASELDFKRALDLATYTEDESERVDLILQIWRAALLRSTWEFPNLDEPLDCLQTTLFFKIVDLSLALGCDPNNLLPPIDMLIDDPSLKKLNSNKNFQSLLKIGYEQFQRTQMV